MLVLSGPSVYSDFRRAALLEKIRSCAPSIVDVNARLIYLVDCVENLDDGAMSRLRAVLGAAGRPAQDGVMIGPRIGTISPWSSKATDVLHNAGLTAIHRVESLFFYTFSPSGLSPRERTSIMPLICDRMTQQHFASWQEAEAIFSHHEPSPLATVNLGSDPLAAIREANRKLGLALSDDEIAYLATGYASLARSPTDVELMMFAQANSEHCRHKIFNADWRINGEDHSKSLFGMIRNTFAVSPDGVLCAYKDNGAVIEGSQANRQRVDAASGEYIRQSERTDIVIKVETHNHPTAISPFPGAATGSGGEIRDEGATGRGAYPKAGLCGFSVSNLRIPGFVQPWEIDHGKPARIASALDIMIDGPLGAAAFNNEFGRPCLSGYFRSYEQEIISAQGAEVRGYHKPIMIAGGMGNMRPMHEGKRAVPPGTPIIVLGGPAMLIGLGGGAASSMASGHSDEGLDFASVQRGNPEMERRCQQVIDACVAMGDRNPILSIHDVGAGGLSNAVPEILSDAGRGGVINLRAIPSAEPGLSPLEIWSNEAQERYVIALEATRLSEFETICRRERCLMATIGQATEQRTLIVEDAHFGNRPVELSLDFMLGKMPRMRRHAERQITEFSALALSKIDLNEAVERVLRLPCVASKEFLITIGDRSVTGLVARDQMVGPWQVPVSDVAVTCADYEGYCGEAMAMGERTPLALIDAAASARMAVGEALTNILAADISSLGDIKLSANWMAAIGHPGEDAALFDAVQAIGESLCPTLGIAIPVGKDSLSMKTVWQEAGEQCAVTSPVSLIISAFAPVVDVRKTLTPELQAGDTRLILLDLGHGRNRLGASALAQVYGQLGCETPDVDQPEDLKRLAKFVRELRQQNLLLAYHDRSDGGLLATLCEMAFAGHCRVDVSLDDVGADAIAALFSEELGVVIQVRASDRELVHDTAIRLGLADCYREIGSADKGDQICLKHHGSVILDRPRAELHGVWAETSYRMQILRDNPACALEGYGKLKETNDPGLIYRPKFDPEENVAAAYISSRPSVAILREQGVNGQAEMAAAFIAAGFKAIDVHMTDLIDGRRNLIDFVGLAACGGFSYGDVLGAGGGWAKSILFNARLRDEFAAFFARDDVFALGVCNGCQMMSQLKELIHGSEHWPQFVRNRSEQFEARLSLVEVLPSASILLRGMEGSVLPIAVAHGEGRATFGDDVAVSGSRNSQPVLRYVDGYGEQAARYPDNPNGSPDGLTGFTNTDGRFTIMMPHPERVFRRAQLSWVPGELSEAGPWLRLFRNARVAVG